MVLVGLGSIGRHYLLQSSARNLRCLAIDIDSNKEPIAKDLGSLFSTHSITNALENIVIDSSTLAVIANWGPQHSDAFTALANCGIQKVIVEKPMATSIADCLTIESTAAKFRINASVHFRWAYLNLASVIENLIQDLGLGEPLALTSSGGALDLSTGGIHWMDFARRLFKSDATSVVSALHSKAINPRSPDLDFYDGVTSFDFGESKRLTIMHNNRASVAPVQTIMYENAVLEFDISLNYRLMVRPEVEVAQSKGVITRYGKANEVALEGQLDLGESLPKVLDEMISTDNNLSPLGSLSDGRIAVEMLSGALYSSQCKKAISLVDIDDEYLINHKWKVS